MSEPTTESGDTTGYVELGPSRWFTIRWPWATVVFCEFADHTAIEVNNRVRVVLHGAVEARSARTLGEAAMRGDLAALETLPPSIRHIASPCWRAQGVLGT